MRLSDKQKKIITQLFSQYFSPPDSLWLFGSRVDDERKGGDIDLYIETHSDDVALISRQQVAFLVALKLQLGDQKIDLVINRIKNNSQLPIYGVARKNGIRLL